MAVCTGDWELGGGVVGVEGRVVIGLMAPCASIGCIIVIAVVASRAVIRNRSVRPIQSIKIVVDGEGCRIPVRIGGMAHVAIQR